MASSRGATRVSSFGASIFAEIRALRDEYKAVSLDIGDPTYLPAPELQDAVSRAMRDGYHGYTFPNGLPALRNAVAEHIERFRGTRVDPDSIEITCGSYEAMFCAYMGLVNPGDEVVTFEPFFETYRANAALVGATLKTVLLRPPDGSRSTWWFDEAELRAAFGPRTRAVVLNTPHNPTGKVFTAAELELIGELAAEWDAVVLTDEVYEHIVYPPAVHVRPASIPSLAPRTLSISSVSKIFDVCGWRVGWMQGPSEIRRPAASVHPYTTWCSPAPLQMAVATALGFPDSFYQAVASKYARLRGRLMEILDGAGFPAYGPEGAYFVMGDVSSFGFADAWEFVRFLIREVRISGIPQSPFYTERNRAEGLKFVRFVFCRQEDVLDTAADRMATLPARLRERSASRT